MADYGDGRYRRVRARWTITGTLELIGASQIGTQEGDSCDQTFGRDAEGRIVLPGTTLAGALRSALAARLQGHRTKDGSAVKCVFGDADLHESPVIVFDAVSMGEAKASVRDGVRIEPNTRLAAPGLKYDREVAVASPSAPIRLPLRFDVVVTEQLDEARVMRDLADVLGDLSDGDIPFGARKTRGMGACRAGGWRALRYDLGTAEGWKAYSASSHTDPLTGTQECPDPSAAIAAAWPDSLAEPVPDARRQFGFSVNLVLASTLLIRSPGRGAKDADVSHLSEEGKALLSGTSVAGALRSHALRLYHTLEDLGMVKTPVSFSDLFGPSPEEVKPEAPPRASRVLVSEAVVTGAGQYRQGRVKSDRFTGGAFETALFEEQPCVGGKAALSITVINPADAEVGLLALALRDLCEGLLPLGGGAAGGRGVMRGAVAARRLGDTTALDLAGLQPYVDALIQTQEVQP